MKSIIYLVAALIAPTFNQIIKNQQDTCEEQGYCFSPKQGEIDKEKLTTCLQEAYNHVQGFQNFSAYLSTGGTGAGKSLGIGYLVGYEVVEKKNIMGKKYLGFQDAAAPEILGDHGSTTVYPRLYSSLDGFYAGLVFVDNAGWQDTGNIDEKICRAMGLKFALDNLSSVRGILHFSERAEIEANKAAPFKNNLKTLIRLFKNPLSHLDHIYFVFNKYDSNAQMTELKESLRDIYQSSREKDEDIKKFLEYVLEKKNLFLINPKDGGSSRKRINDFLYNKKEGIATEEFLLTMDEATLLKLESWIKDIAETSMQSYGVITKIEKDLGIAYENMPQNVESTESWIKQAWNEKSKKEWENLRSNKLEIMRIKAKEKEKIESDSTYISYKKQVITGWRKKVKKYFFIKHVTGHDPIYGEKDVHYNKDCIPELGITVIKNIPKNEHPCFIKMANKLSNEIEDLRKQIALIDIKANLLQVEVSCPILKTIDYMDKKVGIKGRFYGGILDQFLDTLQDTSFFNKICKKVNF